jgi:hypothetical protein
MYATGEDVAKEIATKARQWWRPKQQHKETKMREKINNVLLSVIL